MKVDRILILSLIKVIRINDSIAVEFKNDKFAKRLETITENIWLSFHPFPIVFVSNIEINDLKMRKGLYLQIAFRFNHHLSRFSSISLSTS